MMSIFIQIPKTAKVFTAWYDFCLNSFETNSYENFTSLFLHDSVLMSRDVIRELVIDGFKFVMMTDLKHRYSLQ